MRTAHAMPNSNERTGHLIALQVDEMEQIPRVVEPASCIPFRFALKSQCDRHTVIPQTLLVDDAALALMRDIRHPDTPNTESIGF